MPFLFFTVPAFTQLIFSLVAITVRFFRGVINPDWNSISLHCCWSSGHLSGIPVIFVPGNAGSVRQVRSLGSLLQNKTESRKEPFHFNVFGIDFNEELSGIAGMYLERQIRYLRFVVDQVWQIYHPSPKGLILVGHSMGGIVIRSLLRDPNFNPSRIALIITLGTPHKSPRKNALIIIEQFYSDNNLTKNLKGSHVPMISISGGLKDILVPEHLSVDTDFYHFSTTAIDGVEAEADHLCIVWCNQLVRKVSITIAIYQVTVYFLIFLKKRLELKIA
ncbi:unnamed protein product [Enterobius vermicularis]|uniref:GPI inositol-deacylase n=1 Tax=Enterobius vermicularis TaxID=51028 RepID=A0A3P6IVK9_ENTVE|nr:unnamed protein product [Enterobius vermicularis]